MLKPSHKQKQHIKIGSTFKEDQLKPNDFVFKMGDVHITVFYSNSAFSSRVIDIDIDIDIDMKVDFTPFPVLDDLAPFPVLDFLLKVGFFVTGFWVGVFVELSVTGLVVGLFVGLIELVVGSFDGGRVGGPK
mmetsp:Transcript_17894/g.38684  ORF Transcript_17894/g.38684 Transcript_17894/m.38684 type:complete len:132 (-) Transcript_17894:17-412(-)